MQLTIKKWGNSAGLPLSKPLLAQLHTEVGGKIEAVVREGGILLKPVKTPEFTLEELLKTCTPKAMRVDEEDKAWLHETPAGRELD